MARYEKEFTAAGIAEIDASEMIRALAPDSPDDVAARCRAIAQLISCREGWQSASASLGGAFARASDTTQLTRGKDK